MSGFIERVRADSSEEKTCLQGEKDAFKLSGQMLTLSHLMDWRKSCACFTKHVNAMLKELNENRHKVTNHKEYVIKFTSQERNQRDISLETAC